MFWSGMVRLGAVLGRIEKSLTTEDVDREEVSCERCEAWPCVCGDRDFESHNCEELRKAEEHE